MKKRPVELDKLIFTHIVLIGVPTIFYYCLRLGGMDLLGMHVVIATVYLLSSLMLITETTSALFRRFATDEIKLTPGKLDNFLQSVKVALKMSGARRAYPQRPLPRCSFIVAAYLPNEQEIILDTLKHILLKVQRSPAGLELVLAYNTPVELPVEEDLRRLAQLYPELRLLRVDGSQSKAENLNAAIEIVTGEVTCILDADHQPCSDCFVRAWHWLGQGYDVVQGRNTIRNHDYNLLTQTIAIEFESIYGINHAAKSFISDTTIFGGSNGYWRTSVLKQIRFNPIMLTEDIDASLRTLLNGYRILHDRSIVTTELAPVDFWAFWFQRKRWAQGWLEVSLKYQRRIWKSHKFSLWQKIYWTYLLYYCEFYSLISLQVLPILLSFFLYKGFIGSTGASQELITSPDNAYLWFSTVITLFSGVYQTVATFKIAFIRYPLIYFIQHSVLIFFYTIFKNTISIVALHDFLSGNDEWVVTPRQKRRNVVLRLRKSPILASSSSGLSSTKP